MGTLPIAVGCGAGAASRRPLGLAVVGDVLVSPVITLYVTPVFSPYREAFRGKLHRSELVSQREVARPSAPPTLR
jgi:HAE1 family hydrophobic/amphiphilic exporter-1